MMQGISVKFKGDHPVKIVNEKYISYNKQIIFEIYM